MIEFLKTVTALALWLVLAAVAVFAAGLITYVAVRVARELMRRK